MYNRVVIVGNLTRDAEPIATTGRALTRLRIATDRNWLDSEGTRQHRPEFHNVVCYGGMAERAALTCTKGRRVLIDGRLQTRDYEGKDGQRRTTTEIVAEHLLTLSPALTAEHEQSDGREATVLPLPQPAEVPLAV